MVAGALAWVVWGRERDDRLPAAVSEALAQVLGHVMLPWRPTSGALGWLLGGAHSGLGFGRLGGVLAPCVLGCLLLGYHPLCVDYLWTLRCELQL